MRKRVQLAIAILLLAVVCGVGWQVLRPQSRLIHGKTEAAWIKSLDYDGDSAETERWRALGPQGIQMLVHALNAGNGPWESRYARVWPTLRPVLRRWLPTPVNSYPTRMCAVRMLNRLGTDAKSAFPAMVQALRRERTDGVRMSILGCFNFEKDILRGMNKEKAELLPELIGAMQSRDWGVRNNAALALGNYPDRAEVVPVLLKALNDPAVNVRSVASLALYQAAPQACAKPEVVKVVIGILKDPNDQIAYQAAELLGNIGKEASSAVPALLETVQGTNRLTATFAARALKQIDPEAAAKAGVK
ncbi:MAG TPA: HEAT repeat domain-containing protein [Candidatus Acidoferrum sp.]|jgi:hypothetical protein|nr:HEAT repeat domain-containing protein [Candidatus Acidoferrum sp.]